VNERVARLGIMMQLPRFTVLGVGGGCGCAWCLKSGGGGRHGHQQLQEHLSGAQSSTVRQETDSEQRHLRPKSLPPAAAAASSSSSAASRSHEIAHTTRASDTQNDSSAFLYHLIPQKECYVFFLIWNLLY
jgi:hypothetical protein